MVAGRNAEQVTRAWGWPGRIPGKGSVVSELVKVLLGGMVERKAAPLGLTNLEACGFLSAADRDMAPSFLYCDATELISDAVPQD